MYNTDDTTVPALHVHVYLTWKIWASFYFDHMSVPSSDSPAAACYPVGCYCCHYMSYICLQVRTLFVSGLPMDAKPRELYLLFRGYKVSICNPAGVITPLCMSYKEDSLSSWDGDSLKTTLVINITMSWMLYHYFYRGMNVPNLK